MGLSSEITATIVVWSLCSPKSVLASLRDYFFSKCLYITKELLCSPKSVFASLRDYYAQEDYKKREQVVYKFSRTKWDINETSYEASNLSSLFKLGCSSHWLGQHSKKKTLKNQEGYWWNLCLWSGHWPPSKVIKMCLLQSLN